MLTLFAIQNAKPKDKPYKVSDSVGLHLLVTPNGSKLWRFRYRFAGKQLMVGLGSFPETSLAEAREKRDDARKLVAKGVEPSQQRKQEKRAAAVASNNTFGAVARDYLQKMWDEERSEDTIDKVRWHVEDLASSLTARRITEITSAEVLDLLKKIEKSGRRDTAHRLRGTIGAVFRLAIATLRAESDPTFALRGALLSVNVRHRAAITDEKQLGQLMGTIDRYEGATVGAALRFLALTMTRPGEVRLMRKSEVKWPRDLWTIPAERMKMRRAHDVPLSKQALAVLREVWDRTQGDFVFPSILSNRKPLSDNTFNKALRKMGYPSSVHVAHGFRSSASTILNERGYNTDWIEAALAHEDENAIRRIYNRAAWLRGRTEFWSVIIQSPENHATVCNN